MLCHQKNIVEICTWNEDVRIDVVRYKTEWEVHFSARVEFQILIFMELMFFCKSREVSRLKKTPRT